MDQWQAYPESSGTSRRYNGNTAPQSQMPRDYNGTAQLQQAPPYTYEQQQHQQSPYAGSLTAHSQPHSLAASPNATPQLRDGNGDVAMQDIDGRLNYPMRPHHQHHLSAGARSGGQHLASEPSSAAQRYSPMDVLSPSSPYTASPQQGSTPFGAQTPSNRQSPSRPGAFHAGSYYANRQQAQHLPPITPYGPSSDGAFPPSATAQLNALFGNDPKSPRRPGPSASDVQGKGPVPEFTKLRAISDLQPRINAQPAFRRANPEGGFISVS